MTLTDQLEKRMETKQPAAKEGKKKKGVFTLILTQEVDELHSAHRSLM